MSEEKEVVVEEKAEEKSAPVAEEVKKEELVPVVPQAPVVPSSSLEKMKLDLQYAKIYAASTMFPKPYQGNPGNCMIAIDMANRMGISPFQVAQNLDIIQGNPSWKSTAAIALINNCGRFEPLEYHIEHNEDWTEFSGYAYATEKATGKVCTGTVVDKKMCVTMGWWDKNGSFWKKMPEQMLVYRTSVFFARKYCPEALMGLYTTDEQRDIRGNDSPETKTIKLEG